MLCINKGGRGEGCAWRCAHLFEVFYQSEVFPGLFRLYFRPRFFHGLCIILVQKFPEYLLLALALMQCCCVVKHDVS